MLEPKIEKLVVFDLDGVLLYLRTGALQNLAMQLGNVRKASKIYLEYSKKIEEPSWRFDEIVNMLKGKRIEQARRIVQTFPITEGAEHTLNELKNRGYFIGVFTTAPEFVVDILAEKLPIDIECGTILETKGNVFTGKIIEQIDRYAKAKYLEQVMAENDLQRGDVTVVGDSVIDVPMGERAGLFIAFNPKDRYIIESADRIFVKKDLRFLLNVLK